MAYITQAVFNKLCNSKIKLNISIPDDLFHQINFQFGVDRILSEYEFKVLGNYIYINSQINYTDKDFNYLPPRHDSLLYVFEPIGTYKYHLFDNCEYLHSKFNNYIIPPEVRLKGQEIVNLYREWFIGNGFNRIEGTESEIISKITFRYNNSFAVRYKLPVLNEGYKLIVSIENSAYQIPKSYYNLMSIQSKIKSCINEYFNRFNNNTVRDLMKVSYMTDYSRSSIEQVVSKVKTDKFIDNYGFEKLLQDFTDANKIKYRIISQLKLYINWKCNFINNDLSQNVLESYGLVCCKSCLEIFNNQNQNSL